jgi:hypothetical protein
LDCQLALNDVIKINPILDFTNETAFITIKTLLEGNESKTLQEKLIVVTSDREYFIWNDENQLGNNIISSCKRPSLNNIESRWSRKSLDAFLKGEMMPSSKEVFDSVSLHLMKYLGFQNEAEYAVVTLWIMNSYLKPLFKCYPILYFNAPYESGKTRCLEVVSHLSFNGKLIGQITPASFRRYGDSVKPTFCLDELEEIGEKDGSQIVSLLLNAFNSSESIVSNPSSNNGWEPTVFKVSSPIAIGNINGIRNEALRSRTIKILLQYDPRFKNTNLPGAFDPEVSLIRDQLYCWALNEWKHVNKQYSTLPDIIELSSREFDSHKPLLATASLIDESIVEYVKQFAISNKEKKMLIKKGSDEKLDLLNFLQAEFEERNFSNDDFPLISNRDLTESYNEKSSQRLNCKQFANMVTPLNILKDIKNYHGSKVYVFDRAEIEKQIKLIQIKS